MNYSSTRSSTKSYEVVLVYSFAMRNNNEKTPKINEARRQKGPRRVLQRGGSPIS